MVISAEGRGKREAGGERGREGGEGEGEQREGGGERKREDQ